MTYLSTARERGTRMVRLNVRNLITAGAVGLETDMTGLKEEICLSESGRR